MMPTHGGFFSGIGGFSLGFEQAGFKSLFECEIDPSCQKLLRAKFPDATIYGDITKLQGRDLPYVDVLTFGSPCQDLSIAGQRKGMAGERSGLFFEAIRVIGEMERKPAFVIWENVPGALSSHSGRDFYAVLNAFRELRASDIAWRILDAQYFGVPQRRRRIFLVSDFAAKRAGEILFKPEGVPRNTPKSRKAGEEIAYALRGNPSHSGDKGDGGLNCTLVAGTIGGGSGRRGWSDDTDRMTFVASPITTRTERSEDRGDGLDNIIVMAHGQGGAEILNNQCPTLNCNHEAPIAFDFKSSGRNGFGVGEVAPTLRGQHGVTGNGSGGGSVAVLYHNHQQDGSIREYHDISPTVSQQWGTGGNNVPMVGVRRLMPIECERLQGFPDNFTRIPRAYFKSKPKSKSFIKNPEDYGIEDGRWVKYLSDSKRYQMLGNAVAVPVARQLAERIYDTLDK